MKLKKALIPFVFLVGLVVPTLVGVNVKHKYRPGEYVPEVDGYFGGSAPLEGCTTKAHKHIVPSDSQYSTQKNYSMNNVGNIQETWDYFTGEGTTIAIIDDGFDYNHPEYQRSDGTSAILSSSRAYFTRHLNNDYENAFVNGKANYYYQNYSEKPSCIAEDWEDYDTDDEALGYEDSYATHGTNTSTTAAAPINGVGGVGIAPGADILAIKVDMYLPAIYGAMEYAISQHVDVINMSLGWFGENFTDVFGDEWTGSSFDATYLDDLCEQAYNQGIIVVASAGNEATYHKSYPACNYKVVGVGALYKNSNTRLASFTNYISSSQTGEVNVDILAPGYVWTAHQEGAQGYPEHTYNSTQGTSFSSPIVAGAACLWKEKNPNGTPDQFLSDLQSSAAGIGTYRNSYVPCSDYNGNGVTYTNQGPANLECGRLDVYALCDIDNIGITLSDTSLSLHTQSSAKIVTATATNSTIKSWASSNTNVVTVSGSTGSKTCSATITVRGTGSSTITVKANDSSEATISVTVSQYVAVTGINTTATSGAEVAQGKTLNIGASVTPSNASEKGITYTSNNTSIATVSDKGVITGVAIGSTSISMSAADNVNVTFNVSVVENHTQEYSIIFNDSGNESDGTQEKTNLNDIVSSSTISLSGCSASKLYLAKSGYGIKLSSSKANGSLTLSLEESADVVQVIANAAQYGSDSSALSINNASSQNIDNSSFADYTFDINETTTTISIEATKRVYIKSLTVIANSSGSTPATVSVTGVSVTPESLNLTVGGESQLTATVSPDNATNKTVTWESNDENVATVTNTGLVSGIAAGSTTITCTTVDGSHTDTCSVTVTSSGGGSGGESGSVTFTFSTIASNNNWQNGVAYTPVVLSPITLEGNGGGNNAKYYTSDDSWRMYNNGTVHIFGAENYTITSVTSTPSKTFTISNVEATLSCTETIKFTSITVTYTYNGGSSSTKTLSSISLNTENVTKDFVVGDTFSYSGLVVTANYENDSPQVLESGYTVESPDMSSSGQKTVTVSYTEGGVTKTATYTITVAAWILDSITVTANPTKTVYFVNETFSSEGLVITASYTNAPSRVVTPTSISSPDMTTSGSKTITVTYSENNVEKTTAFSITVNAIVLESISVSGQKTLFRVGDTFNFGGIVIAHYNNGTDIDVTNNVVISTPNMNLEGSQTISVSFGGKSFEYTIQINGAESNPVIDIDVGGSSSDYALYSGEITEGDYVIYYNGYAMKNTVDSGRLSYEEVTPSNDIISDPDASIVWHIAQDGDYWTIYNAAVEKYAAATGAKNKAQMLADGTDNKSLWTVSGLSTYEFVNKANASGSVNANLRNNGTYGFACYATSTGGALSLFKAQESSGGTISVEVTHIEASCSTTYHPGELFDKSSLTVNAYYELDNVEHYVELDVDDCTCAQDDYMFTYGDSANGQKSISISWEGLSDSVNVSVVRTAYITPTPSTTQLTGAHGQSAGITGTSGSYAANYDSLVINGVTCAATNIYVYQGTYFSFGKKAGEIHNTVALSKPLTSVGISAYASSARNDEVIYVSTDGSSWVNIASADFDANDYYYFKIAYESESTAYSNFTNIDLSLRGTETTVNVANFIMYEDTNNQCTTKLASALCYFNRLSVADRNTFMTSNDYVISTARERLQAWARHEGKTIIYSNGDYIVFGANNSFLSTIGLNESSETTIIIFVLSIIGFAGIGGYFYIRKKNKKFE